MINTFILGVSYLLCKPLIHNHTINDFTEQKASLHALHTIFPLVNEEHISCVSSFYLRSGIAKTIKEIVLASNKTLK